MRRPEELADRLHPVEPPAARDQQGRIAREARRVARHIGDRAARLTRQRADLLACAGTGGIGTNIGGIGIGAAIGGIGANIGGFDIGIGDRGGTTAGDDPFGGLLGGFGN